MCVCSFVQMYGEMVPCVLKPMHYGEDRRLLTWQMVIWSSFVTRMMCSLRGKTNINKGMHTLFLIKLSFLVELFLFLSLLG